MQSQQPRLTRTKQLLVEGREDELFFGAFLRHLSINDVQILNYGGRDNLGNRLGMLVDNDDFDQIQSIGIVRDADDNANSALQSVQTALRNAGLPSPQNFPVATRDSPKVSAYIMPDNSGEGALEKLCLSALENAPAMECVESFLQCVNEVLATPPQNQDKSRIHAFLASREDPELRLGEAAQRGYIPWDNPAFDGLSQFLRSL